MRFPGAVAALLVLSLSVPAGAQAPANPSAPAGMTAEQTALLRVRWEAALRAVATSTVTVSGLTLAGPDAERRTKYAEALEKLALDPAMVPLFVADESIVAERVRQSDRDWVARLAEAGAADKGAKATNAAATNAVAPKIAERSGFTDFVALALDSQNVVAADKSAVSVNLNALALLRLDSDTESAQALYRRHDTLRRLGGTFTFGAKVPEGEITGLTGLPSASNILDAIAWDTKVRIIGDRDPRARRWYPEMLGTLGGLNEIAVSLLEMLPAGEDRFVQPIVRNLLAQKAAAVKEKLAHSLQVSVKVAGQHLTRETGKNKYTFAVLGDQGFGDTDLTFNLLYSMVDDVSLGSDRLFNLKTWSGAIGVNTLVSKNALVKGRSTELSLNAKFEVPTDASAVPIDRKTVWNLAAALTLPWGDTAKIPLSVTVTNDPNRPAKEKFVTGYVGISYDFGALKSLFKP